MPETIFKVGVLGATGFIGTPYREEIKACKEARIIALCARRRDLLEAAAKKDGASCITHNWREVVTHPDVNMVIVATPDVLHHEAIIAFETLLSLGQSTAQLHELLGKSYANTKWVSPLT